MVLLVGRSIDHLSDAGGLEVKVEFEMQQAVRVKVGEEIVDDHAPKIDNAKNRGIGHVLGWLRVAGAGPDARSVEPARIQTLRQDGSAHGVHGFEDSGVTNGHFRSHNRGRKL